MPEITMCHGKDCPLKDLCYRFKAIPSQYQSYFIEIPYSNNSKNCECYWPIKNLKN